MIMLIYSASHRKYRFLAQKMKTAFFKLKFGVQTNLNMETSMTMLISSPVDQNFPFWANRVQKNKIVNLSKNFVLKLIFQSNFNM